MKIEIDETKYGFHMTIQPENMAEQNKLLRLAINSKKEAASIYTNFYSDQSECNISIKKVNDRKTVNGITSNNRK